MCRNIKTLFNFEPPATEAEIRDASIQFVRKICGFTSPSKANELTFERAVEEVTASARALIRSLVTTAEPRNREVRELRSDAGGSGEGAGSPGRLSAGIDGVNDGTLPSGAREAGRSSAGVGQLK